MNLSRPVEAKYTTISLLSMVREKTAMFLMCDVILQSISCKNPKLDIKYVRGVVRTFGLGFVRS